MKTAKAGPLRRQLPIRKRLKGFMESPTKSWLVSFQNVMAEIARVGWESPTNRMITMRPSESLANTKETSKSSVKKHLRAKELDRT